MKIIAAVDEDGGIGKNGKLLFNISKDMAYFKKITTGKTVVMGRKTYESIGKPLPARRNIVLTRDSKNYQGVETVSSVEELLRICDNDAFVIGGGEVYKLLMPYCDTAYITRIFKRTDADVFMPELSDADYWKIVEKSKIYHESNVDFQFFIYKRTI